MTLEPTDLVGAWALRREVEDRLADETRQVTGSATVAALAADHVRWTEEGTMRWSGRVVPVGRTLDVRRGAGGGWTVHFADGRFFHPWRVGVEVEHPCAPDHYRGLVTVVAGHHSWSVTWRARGPHQDHVLRTTHTDRRPVSRAAGL